MHIFEVTENSFLQDYQDLIKHLKKCIHHKKYNEAIKIAGAAAKIAKNIPFIYYDEELESHLSEISHNLIGKIEFEPQSKRYVFYDYFGLDNRGLTQQYLDAFQRMDIEVLYILENHENNAPDIIKQLESNQKASIILIEKNKSLLEKIEIVRNAILSYRPEKSFLHLAPYSILSVIIWNTVASSEKYLIDITDHTFWVGKNSVDYFIGFREYGFHIATRYRGISPEKYIIQQYYPLIKRETQENNSFLPDEWNMPNKIKIFTGGALYKMYGEDNLFLHIIKKACLIDNRVVFLIVGSGNRNPLEKYIINNNLSSQVFVINEIQNIQYVFQCCDIYLNTYPLIGGLMSQYAIFYKKPLIGYSRADIPCNKTEELFRIKKNNKLVLTYFNTGDFFTELEKLIKYPSYREEKVNKYEDILITPEQFFLSLMEKIKLNKKTYDISYNNYEINIKKFASIYLDVENNYMNYHHAFKLSTIGIKYFKYNFISATISLLNIIFFHSLTIIKNIRNYLEPNKQ